MNYLSMLAIPLRVLLLFIFILLINQAHAIVWIVKTPKDNGEPDSLRQIVLNAQPNDSIMFSADLDYESIELFSTLVIDKNIIIVGNGPYKTTIKGSGSHRVILVKHSINATLTNLSITNGYLNDVYISDIQYPYDFMGAGLSTHGNTTLKNVYVGSNKVVCQHPYQDDCTEYGGGIYNGYRGTLTIYDSVIAFNEAPLGSAIYNDGELNLVRSTVAANQNSGYWYKQDDICTGGFGTVLSSYRKMTIENSTIVLNTTCSSGGVVGYHRLPIHTNNTVEVIINNSTIAVNQMVLGDDDSDHSFTLLLKKEIDIAIVNSLVTNIFFTDADPQNPKTYGDINDIGQGNVGFGMHNTFIGQADAIYDYYGDQFNNNKLGKTDEPISVPFANKLMFYAQDSLLAVLPVDYGDSVDHTNIEECFSLFDEEVTDQRGESRPAGSGCDVGAYEFVDPTTRN